jgi:hypothetical protein
VFLQNSQGVFHFWQAPNTLEWEYYGEPYLRSCCAFLKRDVQIATQSVEKLQNYTGFRLDDAFHHHLAGGVHHRNRNTFLVHIHADIFGAGAVELALKTLAHKGRPFIYCVRLPGTENIHLCRVSEFLMP